MSSPGGNDFFPQYLFIEKKQKWEKENQTLSYYIIEEEKMILITSNNDAISIDPIRRMELRVSK